MELRELRAFVVVLEEGGMSAAARRLHLSQSTLSHTIATLERQLGLRLLVRTHAGVKATDAGHALLQEARAVLGRYDQALQVMAGFQGQGGGVIRLGIPAETPPDLVPRAIAAFRQECPDVRVTPRHLSTSAQLAAVRSARLDMGLVFERVADAQLDSVLIAQEKVGVLLPTPLAERLANADGAQLQALAGLDWVGFARSIHPAWYDEITGVLRGYGINVDVEPPDDHGLTPMVKFAAVVAGQAFALSAETGGSPLPDGVTWSPLVGEPLVRRTWAVWAANSRRRDVGHLVAALEAAGEL